MLIGLSAHMEAVARPGELVLIYGSQYLVYGLLHHTVYHCRYSQQAHLAIVLGDFYPFHWVRTVRAVHQGTDEFILVGQEPWEQLLTRHLVDTTTALVPHHCRLSILYSLHLHRPFRIAIGLWFFLQPYPRSHALYEVSVR